MTHAHGVLPHQHLPVSSITRTNADGGYRTHRLVNTFSGFCGYHLHEDAESASSGECPSVLNYPVGGTVTALNPETAQGVLSLRGEPHVRNYRDASGYKGLHPVGHARIGLNFYGVRPAFFHEARRRSNRLLRRLLVGAKRQIGDHHCPFRPA